VSEKWSQLQNNGLEDFSFLDYGPHHKFPICGVHVST